MSNTSLIDQFVHKGKTQSGVPWKLSTIAIILMVTALIASAIYLVLPFGQTEIASSDAFSANPELRIAHRYMESVAGEGGADFLALNPEVRFARRDAAGFGTTFLATNPEVRYARSYTDVQARLSEAQFLSANPEITLARRGVNAKTSIVNLLVTNPELMYARRYAAELMDIKDASFLTSNPEVAVHQRYLAAKSGK